ncbi:MAG: alpha/beta hydrolase [Cytophagales bacterium]|nr:alpha/beta hydrolase [Cytophaga sp.]
MVVYFFSGLGADKRAFQKLVLPDQYTVKHIDWIPPDKNESIQEYAKRIGSCIDTSVPFSIVGLSFGGIMAIEVSKIFPPVQTIIISSIARSDQLPWYFSIPKILKLYAWIPSSELKKQNGLTNWFFGAQTPEVQQLLLQILTDTDTAFLRWAIRTIFTWENNTTTGNVFHIHGDSDRLFPLSFVQPDVTIRNGGHLMVYSNAAEISAILADRLSLYS